VDSASGLTVGNFYEKSVSSFTFSERRWALSFSSARNNEMLSVVAVSVSNSDCSMTHSRKFNRFSPDYGNNLLPEPQRTLITRPY
jgi:hypothetical protein